MEQETNISESTQEVKASGREDTILPNLEVHVTRSPPPEEEPGVG
jgi:hypothetical protein